MLIAACKKCRWTVSDSENEECERCGGPVVFTWANTSNVEMALGLGHVENKLQQLRKESNMLESKLSRSEELNMLVKKLKSSRHLVTDDSKAERRKRIDECCARIEAIDVAASVQAGDARVGDATTPSKKSVKPKSAPAPVPSEKETLEAEVRKLKLLQARTEEVETKLQEVLAHPDFICEETAKQMRQRMLKVRAEIAAVENKRKSRDVEQAPGVDLKASLTLLRTLLNQKEKIRQELECSICGQLPDVGLQHDPAVFTCLEGHVICGDCLPKPVESCPTCRQNFKWVPAARNPFAERLLTHFV